MIPNSYTAPSGYTFVEWNTRSDGLGTAYSPGAPISNLTEADGGTVTLYAIWNFAPVATGFDVASPGALIVVALAACAIILVAKARRRKAIREVRGRLLP